MSEQVRAVFENGVFRPLDEVKLPEGKLVQLTVAHSDEDESDPAANLPDIAEDLGISDLAVNIDHYLYGLPKQKE